MPQLCTVCTHAQSHEIDLAIIGGKLSNRRIASHFDLTERAIRHHRNEHLIDKIQQAQAIATKIEMIDLNRELAMVYQRVRNFFDACHSHLIDPDNTSTYHIGPRSDDVTVVYDEEVDNKVIRRKARLSLLLKQLEEGLGFKVVGYDIRQADIRALYLQSSKQLLEEIHRIGEKLGLFKPDVIDADLMESLRLAIVEMQREFKAKFDLDYTWEQMIDRVLPLHPSKRVYLERLREEGPPQC
jgi:hypothetical protein